MDKFAVLLSIFSTIVALVSAYIAQFKKGKVVVSPIRAYRVEPLNYQIDNENYRAVRLYLMITFMNTGAQNKAINDLRVRISVDDQREDLLLDWEFECPSLHSSVEESCLASQPALGPYASACYNYTFVSGMENPDSGRLVSAIEEACERSDSQAYLATLEARNSRNRWQPLTEFAFRHNGTYNVEHNFAKINVF